MGNVSKRQQPNQRAENRRMLPMGLQHREKILHRDVCFSWHLNKNVFSENGRHPKLWNILSESDPTSLKSGSDNCSFNFQPIKVPKNPLNYSDIMTKFMLIEMTNKVCLNASPDGEWLFQPIKFDLLQTEVRGKFPEVFIWWW